VGKKEAEKIKIAIAKQDKHFVQIQSQKYVYRLLISNYAELINPNK